MPIIIKWTWIIAVVSLLSGCVNTPLEGYEDYSIIEAMTQE